MDFGELIYSINEKERIRFQVDTINRYIDYKMLQRKTLEQNDYLLR
jgi:hypothetical protein